jgi:hypothetical protein
MSPLIWLRDRTPTPKGRGRPLRIAPAILTSSLVFALLTWSATLSADMVSWPAACPPGSKGESSHDGAWCTAAPCRSNRDCEDSNVECRSWRVCTQTFSVQPRGRGASDGPPRDREEVVSSCAPQGGCDGSNEPPPQTAGKPRSTPAVCKVADFCVAKPLPGLLDDKPARSGRCRCTLVGERGGALGWAVALLIVALMIARTRRAP